MKFLKNLFSKKTNPYNHKEYFNKSEHQTFLDVKNSQHIAHGNSAEILASTIEFSRPTKKGFIISKNKNFVLKCYDNKQNRDKVYNNWKLLHQLNFNTFKTYRKFEKTQILMTNLSNETQFCTSSNNLDDSLDANYLINNKIHSITNFNDLLNSSIEIIKKAKQYNVYIDDSTYFFIGQKSPNNITSLDIFLGDLDFISKNYNSQVISEMKTAIKGFIVFFVQEKYQHIYLTLLENKFKNLKI